MASLSVDLTPAQQQQLDAFAARCGVSGKALAETFIESGLRRTMPRATGTDRALVPAPKKVALRPRKPAATAKATRPAPALSAPPENQERAEPSSPPKPRKDGHPLCPNNPRGGHNLVQEPGAGIYAPFTCRDCGWRFAPPPLDAPTGAWRSKSVAHPRSER